MKQKRRLKLAIILVAAILFLHSGVLKLLFPPDGPSLLLFLQTGRFTTSQTDTPETTPEPQATAPTESADLPVFSADDVVQVSYGCNYRPDLEALITQKLNWSLRADEPTVLILHSHATESYSGTKNYQSMDESQNMVAVGEEIVRVLERNGVQVLHDKTYHNYPNYDDSYGNARRSIRQYLAQYPSIRLVLDIHRDASNDPTKPLTTDATVYGRPASQLMFVVGTDAGGNYHPAWRNNLSLALKLSALLEQENPGICRPINLRTERFNMDLTAGSLLVEVGAAGDTLTEAKLAANALAQAILALFPD